ncbi:hypothetical protein GE061_016099 [Apolygus lucorum]|uniref:Uncharacterized protein n=1 Tax=Apolygus lucorum TaxID=248454 RepID=A0A6A4JUF0_APOLU|nr:hypothetical protein GE061_016099 [Apolygus lucorum]
MTTKGKGKKSDKKKVDEYDDADLLLNPELPDLSKFEKSEDLTPYKQFQIRPDFEDKFKTNFVREEISNTLHLLLTGKKYSDEEAEEVSMHVADHIRNRIQSALAPRYKIIVHVMLGEFKGAGVKSGARCLWDPECDAYVSEHFINESLFCVATVFGVLFY